MASRQLHAYPRYAAGGRLRLIAAILLRTASVALAQLARRLARETRRAERTEVMLEYHAEAGAPEGALYVDGKLVGHLPGVQRL